jgi:hypothetical protein
MKDLGKLLDVNVDSNQKHAKDPSKVKKPSGLSKRKRLFKKIGKKLNVEKIPGCN